MRAVAAVFAVLLLAMVLTDLFYSVVLARRADRIFRVTAILYRLTWPPFRAIARRIKSGKNREDYLSVYGPLSFLVLLALWAASMVLSFGILQWVAGLRVADRQVSFGDAVYFSGTTLFATGSPGALNGFSKFLNVVEAGLGICSLGLVVGYLPVLYQSYSSRESQLFLLDTRAGSPPSAAEYLIRYARNADKLEQQLSQWERWGADLLQNQRSYPMLSYFRSQHVNQSWLSALVNLLDASAIVLLASNEDLKVQAEATFATLRHTLLELSRIFETAPPRGGGVNRLDEAGFDRVRAAIRTSPTVLDLDAIRYSGLKRFRGMYEPYAEGLSEYFLCALPPWSPAEDKLNDWLASSSASPDQLPAVSDPFAETGDD